MTPMLHIQSLCVAARDGDKPILEDVDLIAAPGEVTAIVGESGSGKSMTALSVLQLLPPGVDRIGGTISLQGRSIESFSQRQMQSIRGGQIAMIFQEPMTSLNPIMPIAQQMTEAIRRHRHVGSRAATAIALEAMAEVQLPRAKTLLRSYPHELSGGMRQRIMIAAALACRPMVLLADEPTTALDVQTQESVLDLIDRLARTHKTAIILITHDLGIVEDRAKHVTIMMQGRVVEAGETATVLHAPAHPYTRALCQCRPSLTGPRRTLKTVAGALRHAKEISGVGTPWVGGPCDVATCVVEEGHTIACVAPSGNTG